MLDICEKDDNLLPLKRGRDFDEDSEPDPDNQLTQRRRVLMISDGFTYDSTKQACATSFSSPDTKKLHKHTRYLGDAMFAYGDDHHASMAAQVKIGGGDGILGMIESGLMRSAQRPSASQIHAQIAEETWEPRMQK